MHRAGSVVSIMLAVGVAWSGSPAAAANPGTLDTNFGGTGTVEVPFPGSTNGSFNDVAVVNSKVVAAGWTTIDSIDRFVVVRLTAHGVPDTTFSHDGVAIATFYKTLNGQTAASVLPMPNGDVLAVGWAYPGDSHTGVFALAMFRPNGTLDKNFGGDGKVVTKFPNWPVYGYGAALTPDGKIVVAGEAYRGSTGNGNFVFARYRVNGSLDKTFGNKGRKTISVLDNDDGAWNVGVRPSGKIVAVGWASQTVAHSWRVGIVRLKPNGDLDPTFNGDGKATFRIGSSDTRYGQGLAFRPNGKLVVGIADNGAEGPAVIQVTADGHLDTSWAGGDGIVVLAVFNAQTQDVAVQDDGKVLMAGNDDGFLAVFRLLPGGASVDAGYGAGGEAKLGSNSSAAAVTVDGSGRAVAAGDESSSGLVARFVG